MWIPFECMLHEAGNKIISFSFSHVGAPGKHVLRSSASKIYILFDACGNGRFLICLLAALATDLFINRMINKVFVHLDARIQFFSLNCFFGCVMCGWQCRHVSFIKCGIFPSRLHQLRLVKLLVLNHESEHFVLCGAFRIHKVQGIRGADEITWRKFICNVW